MSTRLSFLQITRLPELGLKVFVDAMGKERFTARSSSGFIVDSSSTRSVSARYVEKIAGVEMLTDPFGKTYRVEATYYSEQKFRLSIDDPELIVINANASSRAFTGRLSEFSDFKIAIQPLEWIAEHVLEALSKEVLSVRVFAAKVFDQKLSNAVQVRMSFDGGEIDVRPEIRKFLRREGVQFASLKVSFDHAGASRRCEIKPNGTVQMFGPYDPVMQELWIRVVMAFRKHGRS